MDHLTEDALALLRAAREIHAQRHGIHTFTLGTHLPLEGAGRRTGINPEGLRYYDAIKELEYEGAIEWPTSARLARGNEKVRHHQARLGDAAGTRLEARLPVL